MTSNGMAYKNKPSTTLEAITLTKLKVYSVDAFPHQRLSACDVTLMALH